MNRKRIVVKPHINILQEKRKMNRMSLPATKAQQKRHAHKSDELCPNISKQMKSQFSIMAGRVKRSYEHPQITFMKAELKKTKQT